MGLIQDGPGTQILGSNSLALYTGYTSVSNGTLQIDGSLAGSPQVRVYSGATLKGSGFIGGAVILYGGTLAPGSSPGTLTVTGNVTFSSSATFDVELLGPLAGHYDKLLMVGSSLDLGGATLSVSAPNLLPLNTVFPIIQGWSSINSTFASLPEGATFSAGSNQFQINYGTLSGYGDAVTLMVVPEPGTYGLLTAALVAIWLRRRMR
jgi:autotransporter-associated beta strand protein